MQHVVVAGCSCSVQGLLAFDFGAKMCSLSTSDGNATVKEEDDDNCTCDSMPELIPAPPSPLRLEQRKLFRMQQHRKRMQVVVKVERQKLAKMKAERQKRQRTETGACARAAPEDYSDDDIIVSYF